ncbi:MAG TPA: hypothetical protein VFA97_06440 [Gaiellaceae bacterium]|nr:hypothetical protein [Gaiellaceae bacterium]
MRVSTPLCLAGLAALLTFALTGAAFARGGARPVRRPASVRALRVVIDHYRQLTWTYESAAHLTRTPASFRYRRSADRHYLEWVADRWTRREFAVRRRALVRIDRRLSVVLPAGPGLRSALAARLSYSRRLTLRLRRIYPGRVTRRFARAHLASASGTLRLWQLRSADAALAVARHGYAHPALPVSLRRAFLCIHRYEGAWNANTGNGYFGGLQMDVSFQRRYGDDFAARWGTADNWPAWAQLETAARAYRSGRGFWPWPNTARICGLM